ncbi:hypothetical protein [Arthrobacter mobilis]|uniref:Uncharacterized protein n=1 Tax=Arthrobacter mobilis TaxID=2724944 RepID=A0A7X6HBY2_9MICC|nr:hypothetical protein [Arthrobacter mobilis]NKX54151.1 hypothetical protein [Arthrobacter mobilis]
MDWVAAATSPAVETASETDWLGQGLLAGAFVVVGALISTGAAWPHDEHKAWPDVPRRWDADIRTYGRNSWP